MQIVVVNQKSAMLLHQKLDLTEPLTSPLALALLVELFNWQKKPANTWRAVRRRTAIQPPSPAIAAYNSGSHVSRRLCA